MIDDIHHKIIDNISEEQKNRILSRKWRFY